MSRVTLAAKLSVSASWLTKVEEGEVDPTWASITQISEGLSLSMASLAELAEDLEKRNV